MSACVYSRKYVQYSQKLPWLKYKKFFTGKVAWSTRLQVATSSVCPRLANQSKVSGRVTPLLKVLQVYWLRVEDFVIYMTCLITSVVLLLLLLLLLCEE